MTALTPMEAALAAIEARAPISVRVQLKAGARLLLAKPYRIQIAIFGFGILGKLPDEVAGLIRFAERYPFGRSGNRVAVRQALLALRVLRRRGVVSVYETEAA